MRILITNLFVSNKSGSETVVQLLADGLRAAGHQTMLLAPTIGEMADQLRRRGHHVVDRIAEIVDKPDVIHAQHLSPALTAMARFPDVPAVYSCHSAFFEVEVPMPHPQIREWIAVDEACAERSLSRGVPANRLSLIYNAVDLKRYQQRMPLPAEPRRGLLLTKNVEHLAAVRDVCERAGIALDELGPGTARFSNELENELPAYDVVFATARMAIEAAAVGCAVVVCDARGTAGMLSTENMERWRSYNLGVGILTRPTTPETLIEALKNYDADDAGKVCTYFRVHAGTENFVTEHLRVYERAMQAPPISPEAGALATAEWIEELVVSSAQRRWMALVRELHGWPYPRDQEEMLRLMRESGDEADLRISTVDRHFTALSDAVTQISTQISSQSDLISSQANQLSLQSNQISTLAGHIASARKIYQGLLPAFIRKRFHLRGR
ncbi:glycosyltransferase [Mesorhizobium sp. NBSH29]|uniref:glycosyltransferase family 4 protein n=1 Tax=Mesorhizobium sp. NBSH29 TaxID=2654249 RepID=UPI00189679DE|nr:glycosyltransferase family 4 protein [Mesorhizobium sp. NBSH29]QPC87519.1 glycosyltransferase [Mesorhizobium sp. NBSH29]